MSPTSSSLVVSVWSLGDFVPFQSEKIVRSLVVVAVATSIIHAVTKWEANKVDLHVQSGLDVVARELRYNTDGARGTQEAMLVLRHTINQHTPGTRTHTDEEGIKEASVIHYTQREINGAIQHARTQTNRH